MDALRRALVLVLLPLAAHAAIVRVGHAVSISSSASASCPARTYSPTTGNDVWVIVTAWQSADGVPATESVTDGGTNTYSLDTSVHVAGTRNTLYMHHATNVTGGSFTYGCTLTGGTWWLVIYVIEYSGMGTAAADGGFPQGNGTGTPLSTSGQTTTNTNDLLLAVWGLSDNAGVLTSFTPSGGFANVDTSLSANVCCESGVMERIVSATGTYTAGGDRSPNSAGAAWLIFQAAFKAPGGGTNAKVAATIQ